MLAYAVNDVFASLGDSHYRKQMIRMHCIDWDHSPYSVYGPVVADYMTLLYSTLQSNLQMPG